MVVGFFTNQAILHDFVYDVFVSRAVARTYVDNLFLERFLFLKHIFVLDVFLD